MSLIQQYPARLVRRLLDLPRCGLYRPAVAPAQKDTELRAALQRLAGRWPTYGYRRLTVMLRREEMTVNGKRVRRVMGQMGILGQPPARRPRTTNSDHSFPR